MADYDLGSFHPSSEARTFHSDGYHTRTTASMTSPSAQRSSPRSRKSMQHSGNKSPRRSQQREFMYSDAARNNTRDYRQERVVDPRAYSDNRGDEVMLTWRLDPEESLSDWTIMVRSAGGGEHRNGNEDDSVEASEEGSVVSSSVRSKRSSKGFDVDENVSRIELKPSAAAAFPAMLDYIYSPPGVPVDVSTDSAVALRHLATCFGIRELFSDVTAFIQHDLDVNTALTYLTEAAIYNHEKLLGASIKLCAVNFAAVKLSRLVALEPQLFQRIVASSYCNCDSETLSSRVASYLRCRPGAFERSFLQSITSPSKMPRIAQEEALFLITVLVQLGMVPGSAMSVSSENDGGEDRAQEGPSLFERCAEAAVPAVRHAVQRSPAPPSKSSKGDFVRKDISADYYALPLEIKVELLEKTLVRLPAASQGRRTDDIDVSIVPDNGPIEEEIKRLKRSYAKKIDKYKAIIESKEEEIRVYAEELSKFKRVPTSHRAPPLLSQYTFKEDPEYDRYGQSIYGEDPPTALPRIGEYEMDGWLLREEKWTENGLDARNWPMFYYKAN